MLESVSLFSSLTPETVADMETHTHVKRYRRNTVVIERGDDSNSLYVIVAGRVKIYATGDDGKEIVLNELGPGDHFGELALIGEFRRTASAMTLEDSELRMLGKTDFQQYLEQHPSIAFELIRHLTCEVRRLSDELADMALLDVYGRVAKVLKESAAEEDGCLITPPLTQQAIAARCGCSREMVNRVLKELKIGGYVGNKGKRLILNRELPARW
jgi:CRP/FNR family transcriptional regulator, cyclic AMP receptor protein